MAKLRSTNSHPLGVYIPESLMITIVDLAKVIKLLHLLKILQRICLLSLILISNVAAFFMASVVHEYKVSWTDIIKPDSTMAVLTVMVLLRLMDKLIIDKHTGRIMSDISQRQVKSIRY